MKFLILSLAVLFILTGCDEVQLQNRVEEKSVDIAELKAKNERLTHNVKELTAFVASLSADHPNGLVINEIQAALTTKESELKIRETRFERRLEKYHLMVSNLEKARESFYQEIEGKLEAIGRADQLIDSYHRQAAELESANAWLKFVMTFGLVIIAAFMWVLLLILRSLKYSRTSP